MSVRCVEVSDKVLALRNPKSETTAKFMARADDLYDELHKRPTRRIEKLTRLISKATEELDTINKEHGDA